MTFMIAPTVLTCSLHIYGHFTPIFAFHLLISHCCQLFAMLYGVVDCCHVKFCRVSVGTWILRGGFGPVHHRCLPGHSQPRPAQNESGHITGWEDERGGEQQRNRGYGGGATGTVQGLIYQVMSGRVEPVFNINLSSACSQYRNVGSTSPPWYHLQTHEMHLHIPCHWWPVIWRTEQNLDILLLIEQ